MENTSDSPSPASPRQRIRPIDPDFMKPTKRRRARKPDRPDPRPDAPVVLRGNVSIGKPGG